MLLDHESNSDLRCHKDPADFISAFEFRIRVLVAVDEQEFLLWYRGDVDISNSLTCVFLDENVSLGQLFEFTSWKWDFLDVLLESLPRLCVDQLEFAVARPQARIDSFKDF